MKNYGKEKRIENKNAKADAKAAVKAAKKLKPAKKISDFNSSERTSKKNHSSLYR